MKTLVLAEKPSVGRELARVLGCKQVHKNYIEGPNYVVTWALGHLVELKTPEDYDKRFATWKMEDLPIIPNKMGLKIIRQTSQQFRAIRELVKRKDLKELVIATDAGREGELVARWIIEMIQWKKPLNRLWISSQTDKAILDGFKKLRPAKEYEALYESAVCRSEADWLIGLNVTRALTTKYEEPISAGRVQTPTLAMILEREKAIETFKPVPYWTLRAEFMTFSADWQKNGEKRLFDKEKAESLFFKLKDKQATVKTISRKEKSVSAPLPYDLTELQRDASQRFGFSAKQTSNLLQRLYEQHKLVTYPRTDSRYLTTDMTQTMNERLRAISGVYKEAKQILAGKRKPMQRVFNNEKVTDHHAIIPTDEPVFLQKLTNDERKLYDLIAMRFLTLFYPAYRYESVQAELHAEQEVFIVHGTSIIEKGFRSLGNAKEETTELPPLKEGQTFMLKQLVLQESLTEPPLRYSEADLLTKMEKHGLGTPATRADMIERLIQTEVVERNNGRFFPTKKGKQVIELVPEQLKSVEMTAKWEQELEAIARNKANPTTFLTNIRSLTTSLVQEVKQSAQTYRPHNLTGSKCPECQSFLKEVKGKQGRRLVCSNRECRYQRAKDPKLSNRRCPQCHKRMEIHNGKAGAYFQCRPCNIVEKAEQSKKRINKREERQLLKKYQAKESFGSSLADALKKALED